jgi:hypothetical protein
MFAALWAENGPVGRASRWPGQDLRGPRLFAPTRCGVCEAQAGRAVIAFSARAAIELETILVERAHTGTTAEGGLIRTFASNLQIVLFDDMNGRLPGFVIETEKG